MSYCVYILINLEKKPLHTYVGYTKNLKKRLELHNISRGAKFTRGRTWKLIYKKSYPTKREAMKNEYELKNNKKKRNLIKLNFLNKNK